MINRSDYYTKDYSGFAYYNLSRLYNDLYINSCLFESIQNSSESDLSKNMILYVFKNLMSNLKEGLKLLGIIKRSPYYNALYQHFLEDNEIKKIFEEIDDETKKPEDYPNTVNFKYLSVRNDVFHYCTKPEDFEVYKSINKTLEVKDINVLIVNKDKKYCYEFGVDLPLAYGVFNNTSLIEITNLKNKVMHLLNLILTNYFITFSDI